MIQEIFNATYTGHRQQRPWKISVIDTEFDGDPDQHPKPLGAVDAQGAVISWGNDRNLHQPIIASKCEVTLYLTGAAKNWATETLPATQEFRFFLEVYENNALFWRGVILTDAVQFYESTQPMQFKLSAICGLGRLQQFDYSKLTEHAGGDGQLLGEVLKCLKLATVEPNLYQSTDVFLKTNFQWYDSNMNTTPGNLDPLRLISYRVENIGFVVDEQTGEKKFVSVFDYLEQILLNFGLSITFANGCWQLFQVNQLNTTAQTVRTYAYPVGFIPNINPASSTGSPIASYTATNVQKTISRTNATSKGNLFPLAGVLNQFKPPFSEVTTEPSFDFSLLVYRNPAINLSPAAVSENYNLSGSFGFNVNVQTSVVLDGSALSSPLVVRVQGSMRLSITDGTNTRYLTSTGAWVAANTTFTLGFDTDQLFNGQIRTFALGVVINSAALPFAGVVTFQTLGITATELPSNTPQNSLIVSQLSDVTIEHYDTTGAGSIRREFYTVVNQAAGVQSSIRETLQLPIFDRASRYVLNAAFVWNTSTNTRVHSQLWKVNNAGTGRTLHLLVLYEILKRRQLPAKTKEGTYIGFIAPHEKAKEDTRNFAVISSEFSTGYDQMNRVQLQNLGADSFTVEPLPSDRTELNASSATSSGKTTQSNPLTILGVKMDPIAAGDIDSLSLPKPLPYALTTGAPILILDLASNTPLLLFLSEDAEESATTINVDAVTIQNPIVAPYIFYPLNP